MKKESSSRSGCDSMLAVVLSALLTVVFVTLKLFNVINWSWWWVISPIWIYAAICLLLIIIVVIFIKFADEEDKRQ